MPLNDPFAESLFKRIVSPGPWTNTEAHKDTWSSATPHSMESDVNQARDKFTKKMRDFGVTISVVRSITESINTKDNSRDERTVDMLLRVLNGDIKDEISLSRKIGYEFLFLNPIDLTHAFKGPSLHRPYHICSDNSINFLNDCHHDTRVNKDHCEQRSSSSTGRYPNAWRMDPTLVS